MGWGWSLIQRALGLTQSVLARAALLLVLAGSCWNAAQAHSAEGAAVAAPLSGSGVIRIGPKFDRIDAHEHALEWVDAAGRMSFEQLLAAEQSGALKFAPSAVPTVVRNLTGVSQLWLKLTLVYEPGAVSDQYLVIPLPFLDRVRFHVTDSAGTWQRFEAGDTIDINNWPEPARYPLLQLHPRPGGSQVIYLQVSQGTRTSIPVWIENDRVFHTGERVDLVLMGTMCGALVFLILVCVLQGIAFRDAEFLRFSVFSVLMLLGTTVYGGLASLMIRWRTDLWSDASQAVFACITAMVGIVLLRMVLKGTSAPRAFMHILRYAAWAGLPLGVACAVLPRPLAASVVGGYVAFSLILSLLSAIVARRIRSRSAIWLTLALLPAAMAAGIVSARLFGVNLPVWLTNYALMLSTAVNLPLLLVALNVRARDRHMAEARASALGSQDALTGLLAGHLFEDRLSRACRRFERSNNPCAVIVFKISNFSSLKRTMGQQFADQMLLRAVIRMRRVIPESEDLARIGEAQFGVILDGDRDRSQIQEICARLIATGLMPSKGMHSSITLNFQCVAILFAERYMAAPALLAALQTQLDAMSSRSRRPIRFIDQSEAAPESVLPTEASGAFTAAQFLPKSAAKSDPRNDLWLRDTQADTLQDELASRPGDDQDVGHSDGWPSTPPPSSIGGGLTSVSLPPKRTAR